MGRISKRNSALITSAGQQTDIGCECRRYKAGIYARLSSDQDIKKNESVEIQIEIAKRYVEEINGRKNGEIIDIVEYYTDLGKTGSNFEREGFLRLLQDIRLGEINCVIVKDLSRFGRNYLEAGNYIEKIFPDFVELHGDRLYHDDPATICGLGRIDNQNVTIIAQQKGRNTKENMKRNFGMPNPESYRKGIRLMKQAEKFHRPIITFIDTKGAYPGLGAEERGQGEAIAKSMFEMAKLKVPVISIVIGEGSSGGALAICVANKVIMLENSIFSILSPEGYASILWKDASRAEEAAEKMKLTAKDIVKDMKKTILAHLKKLNKLTENELVEQRYQKYRNIGEYKAI